MKKIFGLTFVSTTLIACAAMAAQSSVVGSWEMTTVSPQGERKSLLVIRQEGDKLVAVGKAQAGERKYDSITVKGDEITMVLTIQFQGQDMKITYTGKVSKDGMKGEADFGGLASGEWSAVPHKEGAMAGPSSQSSAANISGVWSFAVETSQGSGNPTFTFKQEGETLTGTYKGTFGEAPLSGTVKGSDISFKIKVNAQGQEFEILYTGKIESATSMKGTAKLGEFGDATWTAKKQ
ncbi:MAG: hypothetical protein AB1631_20955 [Acidobacteriota bacterium]